MNATRPRLTLCTPATYQIKIPGNIDGNQVGFVDGMKISTESTKDGMLVTALTCTLDQAALHGLLRKLYSIGCPLISVTWLQGADCHPQLGLKDKIV